LDCTIHHPTGVTDVASEGSGELGERLLTIAAQGLVELIEWMAQAYRLGGLT
jgi:creatinine amidohydrolase/Fe(II)-dependent formamide hydrolase-like protein